MEKRHRRETREIRRTIIQGVRTQRSVTNTIEISEIGTGTYYRHLARISGRLHDYHAFRNAAPGPLNENAPFYPIRIARTSIGPTLLFRRKFLERTNSP